MMNKKPDPYLWLAHRHDFEEPLWLLPLESEVNSEVWNDPDLEIEIVWWDNDN